MLLRRLDSSGRGERCGEGEAVGDAGGDYLGNYTAGAGVSKAGAGTWTKVEEAGEAGGVVWMLAGASRKWTSVAASRASSTMSRNTKGSPFSLATWFAFLHHLGTTSSLNVGCATSYTV